MTTYSIYFSNQYGSTQNYAFFLEAPSVTNSTGSSKVYGNVFLSQSVAQDGDWTIDVTKTYYAWCGTAPQALAPGVKVTSGNGKLATLGTTDSPGSTWTMINNGGSPAFDPNQTFTANPGAFEIDTNTDFTGDENFLIGLGAIDGNGRMKPAATMEAPRNATVNIAPVTKFYIGTFASSVGTVIETSTAAKKAALIDFTAHPGLFGATVVQDQNGRFSVTYYNDPTNYKSAVTDMQKTSSQNIGSSRVDGEIKQALERVLRLIDNTMAKPTFVCSVTFRDGTSVIQGAAVLQALRAAMVGKGYVYLDTISNDILLNHDGQWTLNQTTADWNNAYQNLGPDLGRFCMNPNVTKEGQADQAIGEKARKLQGANGFDNSIKV